MSTGPRDPADEHEVENRLRAALGREADGVVPTYRLEEIRDATAAPTRRLLPQWVLPVGAAAAVAVVALLVWLGVRPGTTTPVPVGTVTATATTTSSTTSTPSLSTTTTTTAAPTVDPGAVQALPVFYVLPGTNPTSGRAGLVRQFLPVRLTAGGDAPALVKAAVIQALTPAQGTGTAFLDAWPAQETVGAVTVTDHISIVLTDPGQTGLSPALQRLAVQQLVWTATAAVQRDIPVTSSVVGDRNIFETVPGGTFRRPAANQAYTELAPVWIDSPYPGQTLSSASRVVVTGLACVFEANVVWELRQGSDVVKKGRTTASSACPTQGSWSVDLGTLASGSYQFWAFDVSAKDGTATTSLAVPFNVG